MRAWAGCILLLCTAVTAHAESPAQTATESQKSGAALYRAACAACHGPDGKGAPRATVGFDVPLPDFTDCRFATPEADADWLAIAHEGGPVRAFDRLMPAFGDALSPGELRLIVTHLRSFCTERGWPHGDLNLPRPLVTEKAFPENEAVVTTTLSRRGGRRIQHEILYERRLGRRGQYEVSVPFAVHESDAGEWRRGLGDLAAAYKHVLFDSVARGAIVSGGGEIVFPTGKESGGLGGDATLFEPFAIYSQILPSDTFLHLHAGFELPVGADDRDADSFWRGAFGKTFMQRRWGRAWSPMIELLGSRALSSGQRAQWDAVPQIQVSLSTRQHVLLNAGVRLPINVRQDRGRALMVYLLWDWFDGGFFSGW